MTFWEAVPLAVVCFIGVVLVAYTIERIIERAFGHDMDQAWEDAWREFLEEQKREKHKDR